MKKTSKLFLLLAVIGVLFATSCSDKKVKTNSSKVEKTQISQNDKEEKVKTEEQPKAENETSSPEKHEQTPTEAFSAYVSAAKKLDLKSMETYIAVENTIPFLESYKKAYSRYGIGDKRIEQLCKARLATYLFDVKGESVNGSEALITAEISTVNMELLQNKWMETLCNNYPEYAALSEDEMTAENVDVLIQVMIDVLNEAKPDVKTTKDFTLTNKNGVWTLNASPEDIFASN